MISKSAVKAFYNWKRGSFSWMKQLKRKVVEEEVDDFLAAQGFTFKTKPYLHQLVCWYIGVCEKRFLFLLDMGGGKTKIVLDIFSYNKVVSGYNRMLVLVPNLINIDGWADEVETHTDLKVMMMDGSSEDRWAAVGDLDSDVYVVHYAGLLHMVCDRKKNKMVVNKTRLRKLARLFDMLVMDESHNVKNKDSLSWKICNAIRKHCDSVFGLTGTPSGRNPEDFWAQFFLIDDGETLGESLTMFRQALFNQEQGWGGHVKWTFDKRKKGRLHKWIQNKSIRYSDHEMAELPKEHRQALKIGMSEAAQGYYENFSSGLFESIMDRESTKQRENYYIRLRQISSGFLRWKDDNGERVEVDFPDNRKVEALDTIVKNLPEGHKLIVFVEFNHSGDVVSQYLTNEKIKHAKVYGGKRDALQQARRFRKDRDCTVLVANSKAAGQGGNFQVANYILFLESPSSPIIRKQAERRASGPRQNLFRHVHIYDVVASPVEEKIQQYLKEGKDLFDAIVDGKEMNL